MYTGRDLEVIIKAARADARLEAIDECAKVCDDKVLDRMNAFDNGCWSCAESIRALKLPSSAAGGSSQESK